MKHFLLSTIFFFQLLASNALAETREQLENQIKYLLTIGGYSDHQMGYFGSYEVLENQGVCVLKAKFKRTTAQRDRLWKDEVTFEVRPHLLRSIHQVKNGLFGYEAVFLPLKNQRAMKIIDHIPPIDSEHRPAMEKQFVFFAGSKGRATLFGEKMHLWSKSCK